MNKLITTTFAAILCITSVGAFAADAMPHDTMAKTPTAMTHDKMSKTPAAMTHMASSNAFNDLYHGH